MSGESEATVKGSDANQPLKSLGKYLIERKLGQGGMGTVYLAKHTDLKKMIALKVLPRDKAKNPTLVKRFKSEAQAAAQLEHPNIVAVYDTGEADGYLYIAMEYVDGIDLFEQVKRRGTIPVKRSIEIIKQVASALQHAFEQNIVHRDIKPSNLLLRRDGVVKVTDLGLARSIDDTLETNITRAGTTVGTVDYMAPEQARSSKSADIRSDIYSLGCTWYQMLTGEPPFPEGSLTNKLQAHAIKPLPDPREINENIPEGLFAVLQRMTAKKPDDRYQTPAELLEDLAHSKLTNAAFSNEIFSDLSDDDMSAVDEFDDEEFDEEEDVPDDEPPPPRKVRSRAAEEHDEAPAESYRRKNRKLDERKVDDQDDSDAPIRRKSRSQDAETSPVNDSQPLKSRKKAPQQSHDEEEIDSGDSKRISSRMDQDLDDLDQAAPAKPKKKRPTSQPDEEYQSSPTKQGNSSSAKESSDKKAVKHGPKPLPPKREAIPTENDENGKLSLEPLKYVGIIAGLMAVIGGLGFLIFRWSNQIETVSHPIATNSTAGAEVAQPALVKNKSDANDKDNVTVNVVDAAPKANAVERPVAEYEIGKQPLPSWAASETPEPRDLPSLTVGPGTASETHFTNLEDAFRVASTNGAFIRLLGNGPFVMSNAEVSGGKKIFITAGAPQDQPLIIFKPDSAGIIKGIVINNGVLELRGLHFALDRPAGSSSSPSNMVTVIDGQLFVRSCSFTTTGHDAVETTALAFLSKLDSYSVPTMEAQLLLDRVTVRGNGLTGISINRATTDAVIQDSLFVTGMAPAIDLNGHFVSSLADVQATKPFRTIRVLRSTLCARKQALELAAENTNKPPLTALLFQDSVCSAEGSGNTAVLASATGWPSVTSKTGGWLTNLTWTSIASLYLGFDRLLDLDKSYKVSGLDNWQRVWGKKYESPQFQPIVWQENVLAELSSALPHDFDTSKLPYHEIKTSKGVFPGCSIIQLNVPGVIAQDRLAAMNQRPKIPAVVFKPMESPQTKKVDLTKEDLGIVLNRSDWQSGTVFEATGSGTKMMTPAKIVGKSLRIVFRQSDSAPLKLQPKVPDQKANPDSQGLFNIENGSLDLQAATIEASQTLKGAAPPWLIRAKNSSVILRGCQLSGPLQQDLEQHQGLINWTTTGATQTPPGTDPTFLSITDSVLMTTGIGIRVDCSQGNVFVRNSIIAARGYGLSYIPDAANAGLPSNVELEHVTFSTSKSAVRFETAEGSELAVQPVRFFVNYCAVGTPVEFKSGEAAESAILECVGPVREQKRMEWWGASNGIAKDVRTFLKQSNASPLTSASAWTAAWGESNEFRLLTGNKGVSFVNNLPNKWVNFKLGSFALDPQCPGATWADGGRPVGADIRQIEGAIVAKKVQMDGKPNPNNTNPQPMTPSSNKKDIGF